MTKIIYKKHNTQHSNATHRGMYAYRRENIAHAHHARTHIAHLRAAKCISRHVHVCACWQVGREVLLFLAELLMSVCVFSCLVLYCIAAGTAAAAAVAVHVTKTLREQRSQLRMQMRFTEAHITRCVRC